MRLSDYRPFYAGGLIAAGLHLAGAGDGLALAAEEPTMPEPIPHRPGVA